MIAPLGILTPHGFRVVGAMTGGSIPHGLALAFLDIPDGSVAYSVVHILSGYKIGPRCESVRDAQRCAEALAPCADWTDPASILLANPNLQACVREALDRALTELGAD